MIDKITNNKYNTERLKLNPVADVKEKLDYYRSLFGKINDLSYEELDKLKQDIATFFNLKPGDYTEEPPRRLVRISNNNRILQAQGKELSYLTDISQLLAPPIKYCGFGRCNIPNQKVLYCAINEPGAYWETKPKNGDVITLSHFELKPGAKVNCNIIKKEKTQTLRSLTGCRRFTISWKNFLWIYTVWKFHGTELVIIYLAPCSRQKCYFIL